MAEIATVARPYAEAAFKAALEREHARGRPPMASRSPPRSRADPQMRSVLSATRR